MLPSLFRTTIPSEAVRASWSSDDSRDVLVVGMEAASVVDDEAPVRESVRKSVRRTSEADLDRECVGFDIAAAGGVFWGGGGREVLLLWPPRVLGWTGWL